MHDIHGNILEVGDTVYALTTVHSGSQSKRLFAAKVVDFIENKSGIPYKCIVKCFENNREVTLTSASLVKPLD